MPPVAVYYFSGYNIPFDHTVDILLLFIYINKGKHVDFSIFIGN